MKTMELLAPAGDPAALRAAVCAGADAVYLGFRAFGARASAANFDEEALAQGIAYAHLHHVRVYVTVNTLVKARELESVYRALETIALARADAVIVQDMGVALLVREHFPTLALHASTQMALHNEAGVAWAKRQGFQRVVLARECGLEAIGQAAQTAMEIEVFAHGALCAGVSGQCLLSSMAGGRSGNRGRCAQPCRQEVALGRHRGALLSMKDLCLRDFLPELRAAGVHSIKLEGRMKRPEYVAIVTESYRRALDELAAGCFQPGNVQERERLCQIFHRGGFTPGHAMGAEDAELCATTHVGHGGLLVGQVERVKNGLAALSLCRALHDGDGLQLRGKIEADLRYSGKEKAVGEEAVLRLRPGVFPAVGDAVFRLTDAAQLVEAETITQEAPIPVQMKAELQAEQPARLTLSDGQTEVTVYGEAVQPARSRGVTAAEVQKQLAKLGDTPFALPEPPEVLAEDGLFVPVSALNALRREGIQALQQARAAAFFGVEKEALLSRLPGCEPELLFAEHRGAIPRAGNSSMPWEDVLAVSFSDSALGPRIAEAGADLLIFAPWDFTPMALEKSLKELPQGAWLELPPQLTEAALEMVRQLVQKNAPGLGGVVVGSIGQLGADFGVPVALGAGVPVTNPMAARALAAEQPAFWTIWPELSLAESKDMEPFSMRGLLAVYGHERVMLLNHCPERVGRGLSQGREQCRLCGETSMACVTSGAALTDRKGFRFPLCKTRMPEGCVVNVLNALPTDLRKQEEARRGLGAGMLLHFTVETPEEQLQMVRELAETRRGGPARFEGKKEATQGHFFRGVE